MPKTRGYKSAPKQSIMQLTPFRATLHSAFPGAEIVYLSPRKYIPSEDIILAEVYHAYERGMGYPFQRRRSDGELDYLFRVAA